MADYQGRIRLSVQGLGQIQAADKALGGAADNADRLANTKIQLRVTGADSLSKLASQMSAIETRALDLASAVSRIGGGAATVKFNARLDRQSLNRELDLVSRQFQRRNWRLNVNDTSVKTARLQVEKLGQELQKLVSKKYVINVDYKYNDPPRGGRSGGRPPASPKRPTGPGGASPEDIARRAGEAMAGGLTAKLYSDAVAGARSSAARQGLIERFEQRVQRPQSPGGINQSLAQRYLKALSGIAPKGASPQELKAEVERLLRTVDESVIDSITSRINELKLSLQMPRNMRLPIRGLPNFNELLQRMAAQTTRPAEAGRMLQMLPSRAITTDLAGLASRQSSKYLWPSMIPQGGDELFNEIKRLFTNYFKTQNPSNLWAGPERKPYALQEIMAWEPWMGTPRSQRGQRLLPRAGESSRARRVTDFSSLQTSYDLEIAKRNISAFAKEVFKARKQVALPAAGANRAITPPSLNAQVVPVSVRDITLPTPTRPARPMLPGIVPGATPYQEPNWNELMDRMAEITRNPAAASRRLRALPRQMVTTDLAGLATDQATGMFGRADPLGARIRELSRQAGLASSPLDQISDALRNASSSASAFIARLQAVFARTPGGGGTGGGFGGSGGGGFQPFGLLPSAGPTPRPFRRTTRRPDSATVNASQFASGALYAGLTQTSADERRRGQFADVLDNYVRAVADGEQAQRSLNADIERTAQAVQAARRAYVEAGAAQVLTADQVRATRSGIIRERRANFTINQRRTADQIQALEEQRAPINIFRNYGQLQNLYGQLPITQRRGALRGLRNARRGAIRDVSSEVLIGGAFPLLFGQGAATAAGGAIGGAASLLGPGAGFAGGLVGSAIGMQIDMLTTNLSNLAGSLKSPNDAMAALEASGYRVSDSLKFQVEQLQSVGRAYDAQTLVLQEVQKRLGPGSLTELTELDTAQKPLQESWAAIGAEIQVRLLPVLQGFVEFLGSAAGDIGGFASQSRLQRLDPAKLEELRTQAIRETAKGPFGSFGDKAAFDTRLNELTRQELSRRFAGERAQVPRSPQEAFADETTRIQESRRIADQIQSAYREAFQLQRQAYDLQRDGADLNKEIADYSYKKQREIFDLRQQVAEKEIENNRAAAQNRIERGDLSARQTFAAATGFEQQLLTNVRESMRTRKEGEADIEQSRRRLELTMAKLNRDVEDYKRTNAREIEDIERRKLSYVRSVEDYKMRVADYVLQRSRESADFMRQAMAQGEVSSAGGGGAATGYFARLAELESTSGKNWQNPSSNARGFFQLIPKTENWLNSIGKSDLAARMLSRDFNTASQAAKEFAILMRPAAKGLIEAGDVAGLDRLLNRIWTSLPGGAEAATGQRLARANALLTPQAGMAAGRYIQGGWGPRGPNQYGAHFDIARSDASYFERNALDRYVRVNGAPLSSGYTVPGPTGGRFGASRDGGTREHRAWDYAFGAGAALTLTGGAQWVSSNRGDYGDRTAFMTPDGKVYRIIHGKFEGSVGNAPQAMAAGRISNIPVPQFNPVPIGPTPAAAPLNAAREMLGLSQGRGLQDAQRMLEEQNKLKQDGIELGQIEQILQSTQLPQLKQQGDALRRQIEARQQNLTLSDEAAAIADIQAEGEARLAQLLEDRRNALQKVQTQYSGDVERIKQVNKQAAEAIAIAKGEEEQRIKNVKLSNQAQNFDRGRAEILQLQEGLTLAKVEAAALERGELQAGNVELFKASALYERLTEQQKQMAEGLVAQTEELRKQNEFRKQMNELQQDTRLAGAGLRAGMIGAPARAFEEGLKKFDGDVGRAAEFANQTKLFENQQLVWQNLEKNIVDVSDAISGALTNGLLDIVSGARKIEDVGREMLNGIARSFADSAQQQLTTLMQRQLAQLAGPKLAGMLGAGAEAAGPQALGMASLTAAGQVAMFGASLQTVMAQMALSGVGSGLGSAPSLLSSGIGSLIPGFAPSFTFGGFFANGGTTRPGEAYVVGDGGEPEFFFPGTTGRVVPKSDMEKAAALREQSESDQSVIDLRYTVTEQAGQRYVTEEQFRKGMADTSRRTQAITYAGIRNNKEVRDFVGV